MTDVFKMLVPVPEHVRDRQQLATTDWYAIVGGPWNGSHAYVEKLPAGADIVLRRGDEVVRWMYASTERARLALARWNGEGAPFDIDDTGGG